MTMLPRIHRHCPFTFIMRETSDSTNDSVRRRTHIVIVPIDDTTYEIRWRTEVTARRCMIANKLYGRCADECDLLVLLGADEDCGGVPPGNSEELLAKCQYQSLCHSSGSEKY